MGCKNFLEFKKEVFREIVRAISAYFIQTIF